MPQRLQFSVSFLRSVAYYAASRGVDLDRLCRTAGLTRESLADPDRLVSSPVADSFWKAAQTECDDACLGLHSGEPVQPADLGLLGFAMMSCDTLKTALEKLARYWNLMSNATSIVLSANGPKAVLQLDVLDLPDNFLLWNRHPVESSLSASLSLARALVGQPLPLLDIACTYAAPPDLREYERVFGRRPRFEAGANCVVFPTAALAWPVRHANAALQGALEEQLQRRVEQAPTSLQDRVRAEVARRLRGELPSLEAIAAALGLSERALQRDLQTEGVTFRKVIDDLRKELAAEYLHQPRHSITDVSFLLGFSEPSVFHRYFRRWFETTPASFRQQRLAASNQSPEPPAHSTTPTR